MLKRSLPSLLALSCAVSAFAQGPAEPMGSPKKAVAKKSAEAAAPVVAAEVTDQALDQVRGQMDHRFAQRVARIKGSTDRRQAFQVRVEKKRFDFERHASEERKAFYLYLKSVAADQRLDRLKDFDDKQADDRVSFDKALYKEQKEWFENEISDRWKSASLMAESAPSAARVETVASKPATPKIVKKAKATAKAKGKRKSRVVSEDEAAQAMEEAAQPAPAAPAPAPAQGGGEGAPLEGGAPAEGAN
jgi:hypothetical protein